MREKCIFIGRADGIIEEYKFVNSNKIILKNSKKIAQNGITHIELIQNYIICITLDNKLIKLDSEFHSIYSVLIKHSVKVVKTNESSIITGGMDGIIRVVNTADGKTRHVLRGHIYPITCLNRTKNEPIMTSNDPKVISADESGEIRLWTLNSGRCQFILRQKMEPESSPVINWDCLGNVWVMNDYLIGVTIRAELLVWTHRSGHFRHKINLGRNFNGAGAVFNHHFLCLVVDQSTIVIDIRQSKDKIKIERKNLNNCPQSPSLSTTPKNIILFDQEIKQNQFFSQLCAIVPHGPFVKRVELFSNR